jgi:hypothetical protein
MLNVERAAQELIRRKQFGAKSQILGVRSQDHLSIFNLSAAILCGSLWHYGRGLSAASVEPHRGRPS